MKVVFRILKMKVPLWLLLLTGVIITIESVQIVSEIRLHSEYRRYFIEKIRFNSDGIYQNLEYICQNKDDKEKISSSLIGAYHYSNALDDTHYFILQRGAFNGEKTYTGYEARKFVTFSYVKSALEQILNEYKETNNLSESDYKTIQLFCEEFRNLSEAITENPYMTNEQFVDCVKELYTSVYSQQ